MTRQETSAAVKTPACANGILSAIISQKIALSHTGKMQADSEVEARKKYRTPSILLPNQFSFDGSRSLAP